MRIAINTRCLLPNQIDGRASFMVETMRLITQQHPEHQFFLLFDRPYDVASIVAPNITPVVMGPPARNAMFLKWWLDVRVPSVLRKIQADVFVSPDGTCSLTTKLPQVLVVQDLSFLQQPALLKKGQLLFYKRYTPKYLQIATQIATVSQFTKQVLLNHYPLPPDKIQVIGSAAKSIFQPIGWQQKEHIKDQYTGGKEYFFFSGGINPNKNLLNLLKAFSIFKKRQQSNMQLVLCGHMEWPTNDFEEKLRTYKYRTDVHVLDGIPEVTLALLTASAYALVYPSLYEDFALSLLEAMQCGVPVITSTGSSMPEVGGNAALYADPANPNDIANHMKTLYKDENLRNELIANGYVQAQQYCWQQTSNALWQMIESAVK